MSKEKYAPKIPAILPSGTDLFQRFLLQGKSDEEEKGNDTTFHELALVLHEAIVDRYQKVVHSTKNHAHIWFCLNDLAALASAYCLIDGIEEDRIFLAPLPSWILGYIASSADTVTSMTRKAIAEEHERKLAKLAEKTMRIPPRKSEAISSPKENSTRWIKDAIPRAFKLVQNGKNNLLIAARERIITNESLNIKFYRLSFTEAAQQRKNKLYPELSSEEASEEQVNQFAELQHEKATLTKGIRINEGLPLPTRKRKRKRQK
jgi:hypothetical protein